MKKTITATALILAFAFGTTVQAATKGVKKAPSLDDIKKALVEAGPDHYPQADLKSIKKAGSAKVADSYIHVYLSELKKAGNNRIFLFNNEGKYLGYFDTDADISDVQEGLILFDSGGNDDGSADDEVALLPTGPVEPINVNGIAVPFHKAPEKTPQPTPGKASEQAPGQSPAGSPGQNPAEAPGQAPPQ